jgi:hypothetical protein
MQYCFNEEVYGSRCAKLHNAAQNAQLKMLVRFRLHVHELLIGTAGLLYGVMTAQFPVEAAGRRAHALA